MHGESISRLARSAENIPENVSFRIKNEKLNAFETSYCHGNGEIGRRADFVHSVPKSTRSKVEIWDGTGTTSSTIKSGISKTRELWDSASSYVTSSKVIVLSHSLMGADTTDALGKCSTLQTFMNLMKGSTGTGAFTLPLAFMFSGLWTGFFGFLLVSLVAIHCMHIMVRSAAMLEKRSNIPIESYPQVLGQCLTYGPQRLQKYGAGFELFGHTIIYIMQCSFCCVFIVWMAVNIKSVLDQVWPGSPQVRWYEVAIYLFLIPYVTIRDLRILAMFSAVANVLYVISLVIIYQFVFQDLPDARERPAFNSWRTLPMFLGTSLYCFESVCLIIPLRGRMRHKEEMGGWIGLLTLAQTIVVALDTALGFYGYLKFGQSTAPAINLNLPGGHWIYRSVTLMIAASVFLSLAVQFYVPVAVLWPVVETRLTRRWPYGYNRVLAESLTRVALLTLICTPRRRWRDSNPRQKGPCRSQVGLSSHCATEAPVGGVMTLIFDVVLRSLSSSGVDDIDKAQHDGYGEDESNNNNDTDDQDD
ncbi:proton-coupled amino acid transporter [Plakobranchus ocellatus]|uniref:Proton-coupled amino acid transporter n=1 Tax=Plakobranchus ocellatus TaxID=259542 RepID=A0AAV3YAM0_9GAST|nr:proton-coupled amino acid transporter [Plakobranchus ocellatus]